MKTVSVTVPPSPSAGGHRCMGIDPSLSSTGVAVLDKQGRLDGAWRIVPEKAAESVHDRACSIAAQVAGLVRASRPGFVFLESPIFVQSMQTALSMGILSGAIAGAIYQTAQMSVNALSVSEWRHVLGIKQRKKDQVIPAIVWLLRERGIPFAEYGPDEIEAVGIAEAGRIELARS